MKHIRWEDLKKQREQSLDSQREYTEAKAEFEEHERKRQALSELTRVTEEMGLYDISALDEPIE